MNIYMDIWIYMCTCIYMNMTCRYISMYIYIYRYDTVDTRSISVCIHEYIYV